MSGQILGKNSRIGWIDDWKGFMLLIVCLGHYSVPVPYMVFFSSVHVASFFFLSGLLFDMNKNRTFDVFFKKKVSSLLIPYISLSLLFLIFDPRVYDIDIPLWEGRHYVLENISNLSWILHPSDGLTLILLHLEGIFIEGSSSATTGPLWFLWALFVVVMFLWGILRISSSRKLVALVALILLRIGWKFNNLQIYLPLNLNSIVSATAISCFGYLCQPVLRYVQKKNVLYVSIVAFVLFAVYWAGLSFNVSPNLRCNFLGPNLILYGLTICCGLGFYLLIFNCFSRMGGGRIHTILSFLADNATTILAVHCLPMRYLASVCYYWGIIDTQYIPYCLIFFGCVTCALAVPFFDHYLPMFVGRKQK